MKNLFCTTTGLEGLCQVETIDMENCPILEEHVKQEGGKMMKY